MKDVVKKSADPAVNQMLAKAYRQTAELAWDRADAQQPQCGFGRLAICCSDCLEGPCRVNPFGDTAQQTICGRDKVALTTRHFLGKASDGALALVKLAAEFGGPVDDALWRAVATTDDDMLTPDGRIAEIGDAAATALLALAAAKEAADGAVQPTTTSANLGVLREDRPNVILHGPIAPRTVRWLSDAAAKAQTPINMVALCGNEFSGVTAIPSLTGYDSQETPLLTDAVDLIVVGSQCVMPSLVAMAAARSVPLVHAAAIADAGAAAEAIADALAAFERRDGKPTTIPPVCETAIAGFTAANMDGVIKSLSAAQKDGQLRGIAYLGGCGNLSHTQDADVIKAAKALIEDRYVVVTAGCVGAALARAGLCRPEAAKETPLAKVIPEGVPPVLTLGSCLDAGQFLGIAQKARAAGLTVFAVIREATHNKVLATAVAFAGKGIETFVGNEAIDLPPLASIKPIDAKRPLAQALSEMALA